MSSPIRILQGWTRATVLQADDGTVFVLTAAMARGLKGSRHVRDRIDLWDRAELIVGAPIEKNRRGVCAPRPTRPAVPR